MVEIEDVYKAFGTLDDSRESESKLPACKGNVVGAFCRQVFLWLSRASYLPLVEQSFVSEKEDERKLFDGCPTLQCMVCHLLVSMLLMGRRNNDSRIDSSDSK